MIRRVYLKNKEGGGNNTASDVQHTAYCHHPTTLRSTEASCAAL